MRRFVGAARTVKRCLARGDTPLRPLPRPQAEFLDFYDQCLALAEPAVNRSLRELSKAEAKSLQNVEERQRELEVALEEEKQAGGDGHERERSNRADKHSRSGPDARRRFGRSSAVDCDQMCLAPRAAPSGAQR